MATEELSVEADTDALVVVDVQKDFCAGGVLEVPGGNEVIPVLNQWLSGTSMLKVATRDWHPPDHRSFQPQGGPWPPHCVKNTEGAQMHPDLLREEIDRIFSMGREPEQEGYSGFETPELSRYLKEKSISRLWVGGLATDYCVGETVVEGCEEGFEMFVIDDAIRGIDAEPGDIARARKRMRDAGAKFVETRRVQFA
jgi:nicotinamidase/pyrazinamidase